MSVDAIASIACDGVLYMRDDGGQRFVARGRRRDLVPFLRDDDPERGAMTEVWLAFKNVDLFARQGLHPASFPDDWIVTLKGGEVIRGAFRVMPNPVSGPCVRIGGSARLVAGDRLWTLDVDRVEGCE